MKIAKRDLNVLTKKWRVIMWGYEVLANVICTLYMFYIYRIWIYVDVYIPALNQHVCTCIKSASLHLQFTQSCMLTTIHKARKKVTE